MNIPALLISVGEVGGKREICYPIPANMLPNVIKVNKNEMTEERKKERQI
jgi:hypothetical protein